MTHIYDGYPILPNSRWTPLADRVWPRASTLGWALGFGTCALHLVTARGHFAYHSVVIDGEDRTEHAVWEAHLSRTPTRYQLCSMYSRVMTMAKNDEKLAREVIDTIKEHNFLHYLDIIAACDVVSQRRNRVR